MITKKSFFLSLLLSYNLNLMAATTSEIGAPIKDPKMLVKNEILRLDTLIEATEKSLEAQRMLREKIYEYQALQENFIKTPNDNEILFKIIKSAYKILQIIQENHLTQNFDTDFIDELTLLSKPATKRNLPK